MRTHILWPDMPPIYAPGRVTQDYFLHFLGFLFVPIWVFVFFSLPVDVDAGFVRTSDYEMAWSVAPRRDLRRCGTIALVFDLTGSVLRCEQDENKNGAPMQQTTAAFCGVPGFCGDFPERKFPSCQICGLMKKRSLECVPGNPETRFVGSFHHAFPFLPLSVR